jgi:hypothetical protein
MALASSISWIFSSFLKNLGFLVHPELEGKSLYLGKTSFENLFLILR